MPYIQIGRHSIYYCSKGIGPDVLLVHGLGSSHRMWQRPMARLAEAGFGAWALDLPGSGQSDALDATSSSYTISKLASLTWMFADSVGISAPMVAGHSLGGTIALEMVAQRPQGIHALALVAPVVSRQAGPTAHGLGVALGKRMSALLKWYGARMQTSQLSRLTLEWLPLDSPLRRDAEDVLHTQPGAFVSELGAALEFDFTDRLPQVRAPTLVIVGTRDLTVHPGQGELAAKKIPHARLMKIPGAGHQPYDDHPKEFDRALIEFLQEWR